MALDAMNRALARNEVRELIEARLKSQRDEATRLEVALQQERLALGRKMLAEGVPAEVVSKVTGLSPEDLAIS